MRRPTRGDSPTVPRCRRLVVRHSAFDFPGTHAPPLGHPIPGQSARRIARSLCHFLAIGGVPEELFTWIHRRSGERRQSIQLSFRPAVVDADIHENACEGQNLLGDLGRDVARPGFGEGHGAQGPLILAGQENGRC